MMLNRTKQILDLMQWNLRRIFYNLDNLRIFIYENNPDIIILKPIHRFQEKGYYIVRTDRGDGYGGIVRCIRNIIDFQVIPIPEKLLTINCHLHIIKLTKLKIGIAKYIFIIAFELQEGYYRSL